MDVEETVRRLIRDEGLIEPGERVLVGVSGGVDSSSLLFLLNRIKKDMAIDLGVAHVNHGLRGEESERDEAFVRKLAESLSVPCHVTRAEVRAYSREQGVSIQHAGRELRYRYFAGLCNTHGYRKIATAHNRDDQVETFLLRVLKGSGLNGLGSIPMRRGPIIRPLLNIGRSDIEAYAHKLSIPFVEDSSNLKEAYERNFLRMRIVPLLARLNPRFREKILLLISDIAAVDRLFDEEAERFLEREGCLEGEACASGVEALRVLHPEVRFRVISRMVSRLEPRFIALREHVLLVERSLFSAKPNNMVFLPHGIKVKRVYGDLTFTREEPLPPVGETFEIRLGRNVIPPLGITLDVFLSDSRPDAFPADRGTSYFDGDKASLLTLRTFREGDRFVPLGMDREVKVKDYFISRKIPKERRRRIPILLAGRDIIWVVGERMDERYKLAAVTRRILKVTIEPSP
jgi:tRNA(Ile)-lysidine synthase